MIYFVKTIYLLPFIFMMLPAFYIDFGIFCCACSFIVRSFAFITLILTKPLQIFKKLIYLYKNTPFKYCIFLYIWIIISGIINIILGNYTIINFFKNSIYQFFVSCMIIFILTVFAIPKYFSTKFVVKMLVACYFFVFLFGIMDYIGYEYNIGCLQAINDFFINSRFLLEENYNVVYDRVQSTFAEPGWFASFICFNLPIIYSLARVKQKIFKNEFINIIVKYTIIPVAWLNIILTKSPIWLILCIITTVLFFIKNILNLIKKYAPIILLVTIMTILVVYLIFTNINIQDSYLNRILQVFSSNNIDELIYNEASLANRIISYMVSLIIFTKHPIFGVGLFNTNHFTMQTFIDYNIPMTPELQGCYFRAIINHTNMHTNGALFYNILSDTGIIGFIILYTFLIKSYTLSKKLKKIHVGIEKALIQGVSGSILIIIMTSIYDTYLTVIYTWFLLGLAYSCLYCKNKIAFKSTQ